jgi:hypothetical protein
VSSQVIYFVPYSCPRCKAELEVQYGGWEGWRRCPACGHPSLPPEVLFGHPTTRRRVQGGEEILETPDSVAPEESNGPEKPPIIESSPSAGLGPLRLTFIAGLVISLFLLLVFYLDQKQELIGIFGTLAIIFFLLVLRNPSRHRGEGY